MRQAFIPHQQSSFPSAAVLDNFNRVNGSIGSSWSGAGAGYSIASNRMDVGTGGAIYWNGSSFGADQEAYVTLTNVDPDGNEQDLLLKSQSSSSWTSGVIEVIYSANKVQVWTYHSSQGWVHHGADIPVVHKFGDLLTFFPDFFQPVLSIVQVCVTTGVSLPVGVGEGPAVPVTVGGWVAVGVEVGVLDTTSVFVGVAVFVGVLVGLEETVPSLQPMASCAERESH